MSTIKEIQSEIKTTWSKDFEIEYNKGNPIRISVSSTSNREKVGLSIGTQNVVDISNHLSLVLTETNLLDMMSVLQTARQLLLKPPTK